MADYQLAGDPYGYTGYPPPPNAMSQQGQGQGSGIPGMPPMPGVGQPLYHSLAGPRAPYPGAPGPSPATDPLSAMSHKMHPGYGSPYGPPPSAAATASSLRASQYLAAAGAAAAYGMGPPPPPGPHGIDSYGGMTQSSHLAASGYGSNMMGQYGAPPSQRMPHTPSPVRHPPMPSQYASSSPYSSAASQSSAYGSASAPGAPGASSSVGDLWSPASSAAASQSMSPFGGFPSSASSTPNRSQFGDYSSSSPYLSSHGMFPPTSADSYSSYAGASAAALSGVPTTSLPSQSQAPQSTTTPSSSSSSSGRGSLSRSSASSVAQQQAAAAAASQQYSAYGAPVPSSASAAAAAASRFGHYPSPYGGPSPFDPTGQSRLSPYPPLPTSSVAGTPASPSTYGRPSGPSASGYPTTSAPTGSVPSTPLPMASPRRPPATPPAGSPMPPSSLTPGPPSVGSNSNSAFSLPVSSASSAGNNSSAMAQLEQMVHLGGSGSNSSVNNNPKVNGNSSLSPPSQKSSSAGSAATSMFPPPQSAQYSSPYSSSSPYSQQQVSAAQTWQPPMNTHSMKSKSAAGLDPADPYSFNSGQNSTPTPTNIPSSTQHNSSTTHMSTSSPYSPYHDSKSSPANTSSMSLSDKVPGGSDPMSNSVPWAPYQSSTYSPAAPVVPSSVQSRFDPLTGQYGMIPQSDPAGGSSTYDLDSSMSMYDPYNIDNQSLGPPPGSMSYRSDSAAGPPMPADYDPYAANFDEFSTESTGKKKGKGRPKKEPAPKKERKPRTPKAPALPGVGRGRGRGRGAKAQQAQAIGLAQTPLPQENQPNVLSQQQPSQAPPMGIPDFEDYGNFDPMSMYGNGGSIAPPMDSMYPPMPPTMSQQQQQLPPPVPQQTQAPKAMMSPHPDSNGLMSGPGGHPQSMPTSSFSSPAGHSSGMMTGAPPPPSPGSMSMGGHSNSNGPMMSPYQSSMDQSGAVSMGPKETSANYSYGGMPSAPAPMGGMPHMSPVKTMNNDNTSLSSSAPSAMDPLSSTINSTSSIGCDNTSSVVNEQSVPNQTMVIDDQQSQQQAFQPSRPFEDVYSMPPPPLPLIPKQQQQPLTNTNSYADMHDMRPKEDFVQANAYGDAYTQAKVQPPLPQSQPMGFENGESDSYSMTAGPQYDSMTQGSTDPSMMGPDDYNQSNQYNYNDQTFIQEDSVVPVEKVKKPKKPRKSKKKKSEEEEELQLQPEQQEQEPQQFQELEQQDAVNEPIVMDEQPVEEKKPKKKRTKKPKKTEENLDVSIEEMNNEQFSEQMLDASMTSMDATLPESDAPVKPKKPRKRKKKVKEEEETPALEEIVPEEVQPVEEIVTEPIKQEPEAITWDMEPYIIQQEEPKKPRIKNKSPKKKLPKLGIKLKQSKKKKRGFGSDNENSDMEHTPPPSPKGGDEDDNLKRRSSRNTKRTRYNDTLDIDLSDEDFLQKKEDEKAVENVQLNEDTMVVEKILAHRIGKREIEVDEPEKPKEGEEPLPEPEPIFIDVEEFYVKYKNLSYLHCDWKTEEELEQGDRRVGPKIRRYRQKKDTNMFDFLDDEPFNPDYLEVDRVLDVNEVEEMVEDIDEEELAKELAKEVAKEVAKEIVKEVAKEEVAKEVAKEEVIAKEIEVPKSPEVKVEQSVTVNGDVEDVKTEQKDDEKSQDVSESVAMSPQVKLEKETCDKADEEPEKMDVDTKEEDSPKSPKPEQMETDAEITQEPEDKDKEMKVDDSIKSEEDKESDKKETTEVEVSKEPSEQVEVPAEIKEPEVIAPPKEKKWKKKISRHFLVKWRGLGYEESTWELEDDIDPAKIEHFYRFRCPPPKSEWKIKKKPKSTEWKKMSESPPYKNNNNLRAYQLEGVNWLMFCWHNQQNCILADEMGLGKTIQSITFVQEMVKFGVPYPYLVIVPLSTIGNWQREFETWTDLNVVTYHGSSPSRNMIQEYELYYKNASHERIQGVYKFQVMITTFEVILSDCLELSKIKFVACIIDEAHRLKNRNCKLLEGLRMLSIDHRVLLTGTPLQNNVEELFSLLNYLDPNKFTSNESFLEDFGDLKTEDQVDKLKLVLKPMMLRRLKEDVEKSVPPKEETIVEVELTNVQKKYYRAILEKNFQFLSKGGTSNNMPNLMNTVMELRKCCIHPFLINGAEEQIIDEFRQQPKNTEGGTVDAIIAASGKLVLIDKLLPKLKANGHRVLIFSQMVRCLDILEDYLCQRRYPFERIDGRVRGNLRQAAIDRFSRPDSDRFVFLLCTRAGGLGINLTAADTVIIFDSDWNPQNDLQAQARCHRIGQKKMVKIYRLICRNTYEREMFDRASLKLGLDKAVLQSMNTAKNGSNDGQMTKKEIEDLLRKGAYGALMEDDNAGDKFCEEDIDTILKRRTMNIVIESEGKGSTFSKATFATSDNRTDIDIDDPNFWEKWAKQANLNADELSGKNELIVEEPRRRTQTKRYGADDGVGDFSDIDTSDEEEDAISARTRGGRTRSTKKPSKGSKNGRNRGYDPDHDEDYANETIGFGWNRYEFFRVEKGLLTFGWGRWNECLIQANFKRSLQLTDVEDISRIILLFALQTYKGDEKLKQIILEMIVPESERNDQTEALFVEQQKNRNRRKPKELAKTVSEELEGMEWTKSEKYNPELHLPEEYKKHLLRHANKILLRVRLLHYIKNDIIGEQGMKALSCGNVNEISLPYAAPDCDPPAPWWDEEADKSLLVGTFKHGYDRYVTMRQDSALCFLSRCGPLYGYNPMDESAADMDESKMQEDEDTENSMLMEKAEGETETSVKSQESLEDSVDSKIDSDEKAPETKDEDSPEEKPKSEKADDEETPEETPKETPEEVAVASSVESESMNDNANESQISFTCDSSKYLPFPPVAELNNRLRRLLTSYQKNFKKEEAMNAQKARNQLRMEKMEKYEAVMREKESKKKEHAQKVWSRREETDFYKTVSSFGVEYNRETKAYDWNKFRIQAKLDRKIDETLTEYYRAFYVMCKKAVGRVLTEEDESLPTTVEAISEDKANRCLVRIDLLCKIREETLVHPELDERLKLAQNQLDLPEWWIVQKHDKELLIAAGRYGLNRLEYNLTHDPEFTFAEAISVCEAQKEAKRKEYEIERDVKIVVDRLVDNVELIDEGKEQLPNLIESEIARCDEDLLNSEAVVRPAIRRLPERVLQVRLENLSYCIDKGEWPSFRGLQTPIIPPVGQAPSIATAESSPRPSTPCSMSSQEALPTPDHTPRHESQSPFTAADGFYWQQQAQKNSLLTPTGQDPFESDPKRRKRGRSRRGRGAQQEDNPAPVSISVPIQAPVQAPVTIDVSKQTKLQSLLNQQQSGQMTGSPMSGSGMQMPGGKMANVPFPNLAGKLPAPTSGHAPVLPPPTLTSTNATNLTGTPSSSSSSGPNSNTHDLLSSFTQNLLKNNKGLNSLLGNMTPQYLSTFMQSLPPNALQNLDLSKGMFAGLGTQSPKSSSSSTNKSSAQPPPPAHQSSSSRKSMPLGSVDLTTKFKSASGAAAMDKASTSTLASTSGSSSSSKNYPAPTAHSKMPQGFPDLSKLDMLDLRSAGGKNQLANMFLQQQLELLKNPSALLNLQSQSSSMNFPSFSSSSSTPTTTTTTSEKSGERSSKKTRNGSRIDQLALNLQAKKILADKKPEPQITTRQSSSGKSSSATLPKGLNEKDLMAAFSAFSGGGDKNKNSSSGASSFFEEFAKQLSKPTVSAQSSSKAPTLPASLSASSFPTAALDAVSKLLKNPMSSSATSSSTSTTSSSVADQTKAYMNLLESLKGMGPPAPPKPKPTPPAMSGQIDYAKLFKDAPDLFSGNMNNMNMAQLSNLLSSPLLAQAGFGAKGLSPAPKAEDKQKSERSERSERGKRTRSQFDTSALLEEATAKKPNLNASPKPNLLDTKYLASLLDKNESVESKIKSMISEKSKNATDSGATSTSSSSSPRTRISDKQKQSSSSSSSNNPLNSFNPANFSASSLLNSLTGGSSSSSKNQQNASALLANNYMQALAGGKSGSSAASNPFAALAGFNPNLLGGNFNPSSSMKFFMDLSAAAAGSSKLGVSSASSASASTGSINTLSSSSGTGSTTSVTGSSASTSSQANPLASFANLFGMNNLAGSNNLLANFGLAGLTGSTKKDSASSAPNPTANIDFAQLFNANTASLLAGSSDKSRSKASTASPSSSSTQTQAASSSKQGSSTTSSSSSSANKASAASSLNAAAAAMFGQGGMNPLLFQNPSFASMYNPSSLFAGLSNPFLNMNGLANFSSILTPPTSSSTSTTMAGSSSTTTSRSKSGRSSTSASTPAQPTPSSRPSSRPSPAATPNSKEKASKKPAKELKEEPEEEVPEEAAEEEVNGESEQPDNNRTTRASRRDRAKRSTSK